MPEVSIGQVENLEDLIRGLECLRETLETACHEQIAAVERQRAEAYEETQNSECMLERACQAEQAAQEAVMEAQERLENAMEALSAAEDELSNLLGR